MAKKLASKGRNGDTMLMHVNPAEVAGIASLTPGGLTINPETGQPEAFAFLAPLLAMGGGWAGSAGALGALGVGSGILATGLGAGLGGFAGGLLQGDSVGDALQMGMLSGIGGALFSGLGGASMMGAETAKAAGTAAAGSAATGAAKATAANTAAQGAATMGSGNILAQGATAPMIAPVVTTPLPPPGMAGSPAPSTVMAGIGPQSAYQYGIAAPAAAQTAAAGASNPGWWAGLTDAQKNMAVLGGAGLASYALSDSNEYDIPGPRDKKDIPESFPDVQRRDAAVFPDTLANYGYTEEGEWTYFPSQPRSYAVGGEVGGIGGLDPQMQQAAQQSIQEVGGVENQIIIEAKMALMGQHPTPDVAIKLFIDTFGEEAFVQLRAQVTQEMSKGEPEEAGEPVPITAHEGEYVLSAPAVQQIGKENLDQVNAAATGRAPNNSAMSEQQAAMLAAPQDDILPRFAA
jgi:hypothetical protein